MEGTITGNKRLAQALKNTEQEDGKVKRKNPMPRYYGKNIMQHAQKKFLQRKALEANQEKRRERPAEDAGNRTQD